MSPFRALSVAAALLAAMPATAQDYGVVAMESRNGAGREPLTDPAGTHRFGTCVASTRGGTAVLEHMPNTPEEIDVVIGTSRMSNPCDRFNRGAWVGARFMRGAAAEFLFENLGNRNLSYPVFAMPTIEAVDAMSADTRSSLVFIVIGECAARANPEGVRALLATEVGTPEERAAFASVVPSLGGCVSEGVNFEMPPLQVRAYLAEGAYRNAMAARSGQN